MGVTNSKPLLRNERRLWLWACEREKGIGEENKRRIPQLNLRLRLLFVHFEIKFLRSQ